MFCSQKSKGISVVCYAILLITAVLHIVYGAYFLKLGSFIDQYSNSQPLSAFVITAGVYLLLAVVAGLYCQYAKGALSANAEMALWVSSLASTILTFSVALLQIREYVRMTQLFFRFGLPLPDVSEYQIPLKLSLADGIISFAIGFPASVTLVHLHNMRFTIFQQNSKLQVSLQGKLEDDSEQIAIEGGSNSQRNKRLESDPRREVEEVTDN